LLYRVVVVSQRWEFKNTAKNFLQSNRVEKFLQKIDKKSQTDFFLGFVLSRCWAFLGEGILETPQSNVEGTNLALLGALVLFWPLTHHHHATRNTEHGRDPRGPRFLFCFGGPGLAACGLCKT
jgi:hypothetical protein